MCLYWSQEYFFFNVSFLHQRPGLGTHREGLVGLLAPGHECWARVQEPLGLDQSLPAGLGLPASSSCADGVWNGGAVFPQIVLTLCGSNWPGSSQRPCFWLSFCSISYREMAGTTGGVGWRWVSSGKFCPLLREISCSPPTNTHNSHHEAQADNTSGFPSEH